MQRWQRGVGAATSRGEQELAPYSHCQLCVWGLLRGQIGQTVHAHSACCVHLPQAAQLQGELRVWEVEGARLQGLADERAAALREAQQQVAMLQVGTSLAASVT